MIKKLLLSLLLLFNISCEKNDIDKSETTPINFSGEIESCSDFTVRKFLNSENFSSAITITGLGRETLSLTSEFSEHELPNDNIYITISEWDNPAYDILCNDTPIEIPTETALFNAISGSIKIKVAIVEELEFETFYNITLELNNIIFENNEGEKKNLSYLIIENAVVGWLPG